MLMIKLLELNSTQRGYAQTAQACGKALIALINEVLDRAKIHNWQCLFLIKINVMGDSDKL
jgi:hypothetical protein